MERHWRELVTAQRQQVVWVNRGVAAGLLIDQMLDTPLGPDLGQQFGNGAGTKGANLIGWPCGQTPCDRSARTGPVSWRLER